MHHVEVLCPSWQHHRPHQIAAALDTDRGRVSSPTIVRLVVILHLARDGGSSLRKDHVCHSVGFGVRHAAPHLCHPLKMGSELLGSSRPFLLSRNRGCVGSATKSHIRLQVARLLQFRHVVYQCQVFTPIQAVITQQRLWDVDQKAEPPRIRQELRRPLGCSGSEGRWTCHGLLVLSRTPSSSTVAEHRLGPSTTLSGSLVTWYSEHRSNPSLRQWSQQGNVASQQIILCALQDERNGPGPTDSTSSTSTAHILLHQNVSLCTWW